MCTSTGMRCIFKTLIYRGVIDVFNENTSFTHRSNNRVYINYKEIFNLQNKSQNSRLNI